MTMHEIATCDESNGLWLPLTEYSVRTGISTSTIRRKIKSNTIHYRLENGRYLIHWDSAIEEKTHMTMHVPPIERPLRETTPKVSPKPRQEESFEAPSSSVLPLMERAVQMVSQSFERTLEEKEERIRLLEKRNGELEERLEELKSLVQVLEEKYQVRY